MKRFSTAVLLVTTLVLFSCGGNGGGGGGKGDGDEGGGLSAANDGFTVIQDSDDNALDVLANDTDPEPGDSVTITDVGLTDHGGTVVNNGNDLSYTPAPGYFGTETFTYTITNDGGETDTATVTVTVQEINPPEATDDAYSVAEDSARNVLDVLDNDTDPDPGDSLTIVEVRPTSGNGTVVNNGTSVSYTPAAGFAGTETFDYTIEDTVGLSDTATVTVTVIPGNTRPTATNDAYAVAEDSTGNVLDVLDNDTDPDLGDTLAITAVGPTNQGGTVANNGTDLSYMPAADFVGTETFSYTIEDEDGLTDTASVTVDVVVNPPGTYQLTGFVFVFDDPDLGTVTEEDVASFSGEMTITDDSIRQLIMIEGLTDEVDELYALFWIDEPVEGIFNIPTQDNISFTVDANIMTTTTRDDVNGVTETDIWRKTSDAVARQAAPREGMRSKSGRVGLLIGGLL